MSPNRRPRGPFPRDLVVGRSPALEEALGQAAALIDADPPVLLLTGEAGTGKELVARTMHAGGAAPADPFVVVGCSGIPQPLVEAELFGQEQPLLGPAARKAGLIELAGAGVLFLTELADLPVWLQPALLRAIVERRLRPVGGTAEVEVRCRFVLAAGGHLDPLVEAGLLREDLANLLARHRLHLPALRERPEDVELLAQHFLDRWCRDRGQPPKRLDASAVETLQRHAWPGNVRELRYVVEQAAARVDDERLCSTHLTIRHRLSRAGSSPGTVSVAEIAVPPGGKALDEVEREAILLTMELTRGNQSAAARILQVSRPTLARKLRVYGVRSLPER